VYRLRVIAAVVSSACLFVLTTGSALASPVPPIVSPTSGTPNPVPSAGSVLISTPAGNVQMPPYDGDPNAFGQVFESPCQYTGSDTYTQGLYGKEGFGANTNYVRYPGHCTRIHLRLGPLVVKPGQNDVLIQPLPIEKPAQDGYITMFQPNLVDQNGNVPPVDQIHLHHATWLNLTNNYGNSAFFASGEEKTIAPFPTGYGMPVQATDQWQLLYMIHSQVEQPKLVYITYDVDFVPKADGDAIGMKPIYPVWMDVRPSTYPVFNVQRKYADANGLCTWPKQECADFDQTGGTFVGQGEPGNGIGTDLQMPARGGSMGQMTNFQGGTIVVLGGHLHPGGIQNEIDLVRAGQAKRIYNGIATYWSHTNPSQCCGPDTSWNFSMRVSGSPYYGVHVDPGDILRSNVVYDAKSFASYEDMGIVVAYMSPDNPDGTPNAPGVDPFTAPVDNSDRCDSGGVTAATPTLCPNGMWETHGTYAENTHFTGPTPGATITAADGPNTSNIGIGDFLYTPGDLSTIGSTGIPTVKLGSTLTFTNLDTAIDAWHTITTCAYPCIGETGADYPVSDGTTSTGRSLDLDSGQLGYGVPTISGVKNQAQWSIPVTSSNGYQPGEIVTFFCRIHPGMRGAFKVVQ
jgi:hypothetical protein